MIGAGIGGLSAAIEAAISGFEVTVYEAREQAGGKACPITERGYTLDPGPSIIILPETYQKLIAKAGLNPDALLMFNKVNPTTRVFFQEGSAESSPRSAPIQQIDLPADWDELLAVASQVEPQDAANLAEMMATLGRWRPYIESKFMEDSVESPLALADPKLFKFGREMGLGKEYKSIVDAKFKSTLFRALFYGFPSYSGLTYRTKSPSPWFIPYYMLKEGIHVAEGGVKSIPAALEHTARSLGVKFRLSDRVIGILTDRGRVTAIESQGSERLKVEGIISAIDHTQMQSLLGRPVGKFKPSLSYMTLHLGLKNPPDGLSSHNLLITQDFEEGFSRLYDHRSGPNWGVTYINAPHVDTPSCSPDRGGQLFFVTPCPAVVSTFDAKSESNHLKEKLLRLTEDFGFSVDPADVEVEVIQSPDVFASRDGNPFGSLFGAAEEARFFGLLPGLKDRTIKNLVYCGASVQPGAGMPMACLSGQRSAKLLHHFLKIGKP